MNTRRKGNSAVLDEEAGPPEIFNSDDGLGKTKDKTLAITAPNFQTAEIWIIGTSPYVQNKFSAKASSAIREKQESGERAKKGAKREPKDFKACYEGAQHKTAEGKFGVPAPAFRNAMISACKLVGFRMTQGKLTIFIEADGIDVEDGTPLVFIADGKPECFIAPVRNASGVVDLRARPMWKEGWRAKVRIRFDADIFSATDILNLIARAGQQVGVGEGRPDSKRSCGMGWGMFRPLGEVEVKS